LRVLLACLVALSLSACGLFGSKPSGAPGMGKYYLDDGPPDSVPGGLDNTPDAVPREEPFHKFANRPYTVFGVTYVPVVNKERTVQRGIASWYGKKFHGQKTSSGEIYDMFAMTAAHKTLPLPTYVRVTNLANRKSVVVKVNDRGPFHQGRIIDLSYAAATRLGILGQGSADVEVEALDPSAPAQPPAASPKFIEVGATDDPIYAVALREEVNDLKLGAVEIRSEERPNAVVHRVLLGPFPDRPSLEQARAQLQASHHEAKPVED
jgi:rare lipoprotein A